MRHKKLWISQSHEPCAAPGTASVNVKTKEGYSDIIVCLCSVEQKENEYNMYTPSLELEQCATAQEGTTTTHRSTQTLFIGLVRLSPTSVIEVEEHNI